jgi:transcriptional regulator with XRE-family HTH domain
LSPSARPRQGTKVREDAPMPRIGAKIRHTRLLKGLTLRSLAVTAQCSESLLSKIENGRANPSLNMVHRIASALGTPVSGLFQHTGDPDEIVLRSGQRPIIETDQVRRGNGVQLEVVIPTAAGHLLSGYINHIKPGGGSESVIQHDGEEFGYVLEGEIELNVATHRYRLTAGDTFHFRSELAHSYRNIGKKNARILWLNTPPTF